MPSTASRAPPTAAAAPRKPGGVAFHIAIHAAKLVSRDEGHIHKPEEILERVWQETTKKTEGNENVYTKCAELLHSSLGKKSHYDGVALAEFVPRHNGFVNTVIEAYNQHHHLVIRPDDVWISILSQLNLFVNAHAEDLRATFVQHEGQRELEIIDDGNRNTADFGWMTRQMVELLRKNINDESFCDFVVPGFSTTTDNDLVISSAMMMSTLKAYFAYKFSLRCGIPSITLLGTKADYTSILARLAQFLPSSDGAAALHFDFGPEARAFAALLYPVLQQFASAFDLAPTADAGADGRPASASLDPAAHAFWSRICHVESGGTGPSYLGGWLAAFCVWNEKGVWQGPDVGPILAATSGPPAPLTVTPTVEVEGAEKEVFFGCEPPQPLVYAGREYPVIDLMDVPPGFCDVDVLLDDNGQMFKCMLVAGHLGFRVSSLDGAGSREGRVGADTLRPAPQWFMFVKETVREQSRGEWDD